MKVIVLPYDPKWALDFQTLEAELEHLLHATTYLKIEHIGSTSVPGLAAKPVIDIDVVISSHAQLAAVSAALTANRPPYYQAIGERGITDRFVFLTRAPPARNVYVCIEGSHALRNHLLVRNTCRADEEVRDRYGLEKLRLAELEWENIDAYCEAKNEVVQWVLKRAGMDEEEREKIRSANTDLRTRVFGAEGLKT